MGCLGLGSGSRLLGQGSRWFKVTVRAKCQVQVRDKVKVRSR